MPLNRQGYKPIADCGMMYHVQEQKKNHRKLAKNRNIILNVLPVGNPVASHRALVKFCHNQNLDKIRKTFCRTTPKLNQLESL